MKYLKISFAFLVLINFVSVQSLLACPPQDHVVSLQEIKKQLESQSSKRINNIQDIQKLLRHSEVQKQVGGLIDLEKIEVAVASLDNMTLEDLASRSRMANDQLQAGISKIWTIVIIVGVAFLVVGIVITAQEAG